VKQLVELKSLLKESSGEATQILAVSIDNHADSQRLITELQKDGIEKVEFPLLEDQNHKVIDRYGLLNPQGKGWPHPATYVIDKQGVVRWKFVEVDYKVRPTNVQILDALKAVQ
jgi:alkyl hydroperoxide reductase subunit AhpC